MSKGLSSINISVPRGQIRAIIEFTTSYVQHRPTYLKVHVAYLKAMLFSNYVGYDMGYVTYLRSII